MGPARAEMRAVGLVEVDAADEARTDAGGPGAPGEPGGRTGRGRAPPRRGSRVAAVAPAVGLVAVLLAVVDRWRETARLAAVAELPGVLDPVDGPPVEVWRSDQRLWAPLWHVGDVLVGVSDVWDGSRDVVVAGLDVRTGRTRWSTTVVVCVSIDELGPDPQDLSDFEPRRARYLVLAAATGEVLAERAVDPTTSLAGLGTDVVVVVKEVLADGRVRVTRTDPYGEAVAWTFTGPASDAEPEYSPVRFDDGLVVVAGEAGWVLDGDGVVVHAWEADRPAAAGRADVVRGRALVQPLRDLPGSTSVVDLASGRSLAVDGYPLSPTVDDGSIGDVVLLQSARGDGLVAHDVRPGDPVWTVPGEDAGGLVVLDGRVVRVESGARAVDARTGATVWTSPATGRACTACRPTAGW